MTEIISVECTHVHGQAWTPNSCSTQQELSVVQRAEREWKLVSHLGLESYLNISEAL